jgi:hypothetical protein
MSAAAPVLYLKRPSSVMLDGLLDLEQNQSEYALIESMRGGFFLRIRRLRALPLDTATLFLF